MKKVTSYNTLSEGLSLGSDSGRTSHPQSMTPAGVSKAIRDPTPYRAPTSLSRRQKPSASPSATPPRPSPQSRSTLPIPSTSSAPSPPPHPQRLHSPRRKPLPLPRPRLRCSTQHATRSPRSASAARTVRKRPRTRICSLWGCCIPRARW